MEVQIISILNTCHASRIGEIAEWNIHSIFHMTISKLYFFANIYNYQVVIEWNIHCYFISIYINNQINRLTGFLPCFIAALQIPFKSFKTHTRQAYDSFFLLPFFGYQDQVLIKWQ